MSQTILKYTDTALPTTGAAVTLFNSVTAFPPGGSFHLLNQQWYQYAIAIASAADGASAVVTGQFSDDKGVSWVTFYTGGTIADGTSAALGATVLDEVYVGMFKDVRFTLATSGENTTIFRINQALNCDKSSSKALATERLVVTPA